MNEGPLPADLLAILNAPCPPLSPDVIEKLNAALNETIKEMAEKNG